jgi:hypothetical protein
MVAECEGCGGRGCRRAEQRIDVSDDGDTLYQVRVRVLERRL